MKKLHLTAAFLILAGNASPVMAYTTTPAGKITSYSIGWDNPNLSVQMNIPVSNPDNCSDASSYMMSYTSTSIQAVTSVVITAHATGSDVKLVLNGCVQNRPQIVGINVV
ncbi:hypothetical protein [Asticcacaulis sp. 201]|uniref:hypothetical protein n=1 Tax=Asticcacaulis sp. 201 TaxID=3028787 RepID=UPI0029166434|nr:hypothetical protein [Asticcacaulis sp. 201]MDV6331322.1 hypothetical protein [Asticcacaulis sp. 201]